jgi:hypothetical protein
MRSTILLLFLSIFVFAGQMLTNAQSRSSRRGMSGCVDPLVAQIKIGTRPCPTEAPLGLRSGEGEKTNNDLDDLLRVNQISVEAARSVANGTVPADYAKLLRDLRKTADRLCKRNGIKIK